MVIKQCGFCELPTTETDDHGFCKVCSNAFKVLTAEEIIEIQNRVGFKRQTPDREFSKTSV